MGYTTYFFGEFQFDRPLAAEHCIYLTRFSETRRMRRDATLTAAQSDPIREAAGLFEVGHEGGYFVGQAQIGILDPNMPPEGQPELWCRWIPNEEGTTLVWDGTEKFYEYVGWLNYLIEHFIAPWGYKLNGAVSWEGENPSDSGVIKVRDNKTTAIPHEYIWEEPNFDEAYEQD